MDTVESQLESVDLQGLGNAFGFSLEKVREILTLIRHDVPQNHTFENRRTIAALLKQYRPCPQDEIHIYKIIQKFEADHPNQRDDLLRILFTTLIERGRYPKQTSPAVTS
ncbi:hypothetical protein KW785_00685 [Candidatus Parcubacteria bacterium]|nr:hypothetical protein [Candidatus Parcubacteria bacterium]